METGSETFKPLAASSKRLARRLLTIGENRLEIFAVEVQEEREHLLRAILLALGLAAFGLLAGGAVTALVAVLLWTWSPSAVLLILTLLYAAAAAWFGRQLKVLLADWQTFPASMDQLRKDRKCVEEILG